jgi:adenylate cyclase
MFIDLRGFTSLSENRLPYDVVYILNRFFAHTGEAIVASGGTIDKYLGDGLIALFGQESEPADAARAALRAASAIDVGLDIVTRELEHELRTPLRLGIGIHLGPLVIGRIGHPRTAAITVIGRTVNTAARLEALTKELDCQLVASLETIERAGIPLDNLRRETVQVRGLSESIDVVCIDRARDLVLR